MTISGSVPSGYLNITTKIFSATIRDIRSKLQLAGEGFKITIQKQVSLLASVPFIYVQAPYSLMNYVILNSQQIVILPYVTEVSTEFLYRYIGIGKTPSIVANVWAYVSKTPDIYSVISTGSYYAPTSVAFTYDYLPAPVPEPSTYGLSLAILVMLYRLVRRFGLVI